MDEVYTCDCKCQKWIIHDEFIECSNCSEKYYVRTVVITGAIEFNEFRKRKQLAKTQEARWVYLDVINAKRFSSEMEEK